MKVFCGGCVSIKYHNDPDGYGPKDRCGHLKEWKRLEEACKNLEPSFDPVTGLSYPKPSWRALPYCREKNKNFDCPDFERPQMKSLLLLLLLLKLFNRIVGKDRS